MLIVISGPIASGKSTVAVALAGRLEGTGMTAATVDLDLVYEMLDHSSGGPKDQDEIWRLARRSAAALANAFIDDGVDVVIIEGSFLEAQERAELTERLSPGPRPVFVTLQVSFEVALRRAQADPTRGVSRDPAFLGAYFEGVADVVRHPPNDDLVIDTEVRSIEDAVTAISALISAAGEAD